MRIPSIVGLFACTVAVAGAFACENDRTVFAPALKRALVNPACGSPGYLVKVTVPIRGDGCSQSVVFHPGVSAPFSSERTENEWS